jgi:hypothetical protein
MISKLKITDGDLIVVNLEGENVPQSHIERVRDKLDKWCKQRGLENVEILIGGGKIKLSVAALSVNDVFEDELLKGETND